MTQPVRCAIVLAGGSGQRLRPFVHRMRGDALPKQYVRFTGSRSLLEQAFDRVERLIPPERVYTIAGVSHLQFPEAEDQLSGRPPGTVILQPENKETAPGVLLPLLHLVARYPDSVVAVFPSDHFIDPEGLFMGYVDLAFQAVEHHPTSLVLLGAEPHHAEPEYGYVVPACNEVGQLNSNFRRVLTFVEKPTPESAKKLVELGALWNTLVMTFRPKTLLDLIARVEPPLRAAFERIRFAIGTPQEARAVEDVYRDLQPVNFSRTVLAATPGRRSPVLLVLPARGVSWSDWGSEQRIMSALNHARQTRYAGSCPLPATSSLPDVV
ncbi:MAG: sugar phosphate nucleotidyltransferase [Nitrospirota bacterium]